MNQPTAFAAKLFHNAGYFFIALLALSVIAFWEPYFSLVLDGDLTAITTNYKHFHVLMAVFWLALLITQPYLIQTNKRAQHRLVGKSGYVLGPLDQLRRLVCEPADHLEENE